MKTFKDNSGHTWVIGINVFAVKRVRALVGVDLYGLVNDGFEGLGKLLADPITLVDVLYCLCKDEADKQGVSDEDFGRAMAGDAIYNASEAFFEELADFFPDPHVRTALRKAMEKTKVLRSLMADHVGREMDAIDLESEARKLIGSSGNGRASSESTPAPSPSESLP